MQMRRGYSARSAYSANLLGLPDLLAHDHIDRRQVRIVGLVSIAVIDDHQPAIAAEALRKSDDSVGCGVHRSTDRRSNVHALVISAFTREGISTRAVAAHQRSVDRPDARARICMPAMGEADAGKIRAAQIIIFSHRL